MRMWMVDPERMCNQHLLGEHNEIHMFIGSLTKKKKLDGFLIKGLLEPNSIKSRHEELLKEMIKRGFNHHSPIVDVPDISYLEDLVNVTVNPVESYKELLRRCEKCRLRLKED